MKPEPYIPPAPPLSEHARLILRCSAAGGAHPVSLAREDWPVARELVALGLGAIEARRFTASPAGVAAVTVKP